MNDHSLTAGSYRGPCDLLADLREELMPLNLMIYVGFGGTYLACIQCSRIILLTTYTYTPGHKDICGSLGHNVMTYSEEGAYAVLICFIY